MDRGVIVGDGELPAQNGRSASSSPGAREDPYAVRLSCLTRYYDLLQVVQAPEAVSGQARDLLRDCVGYDVVNIYRSNDTGDGQRLTDSTVILDVDSCALGQLMPPFEEGELYRVILPDDPYCRRLSMGVGRDVGSVAHARIPSQHNLTGVLEVAFFSPRGIAPSDTDFLKTMASMMGNALIRISLASQHTEGDALRSILESPHLYILTADREGRTQLVNRRFKDVTGFGRSDIPTIGEWHKFLTHETYRKIKGIHGHILSTGKTVTLVNKVYTSSGEEAVVSWVYEPLYGIAGDVIGIICIGQDVTEQHELQGQLSELYAFLSRSLEARDPAALVSETCRTLHRLFDIVSLTVAMRPRPTESCRVMYSDDPDAREGRIPSSLEAQIWLVATTGVPYRTSSVSCPETEPSPSLSLPVRRGDTIFGVLHAVFYPGHPYAEHEQHYLEAACDILAITWSLVQVLTDVRTERAFNSSLLASAQAYIAVLDMDGTINQMNPSALDALGWADASEKTLQDIVPFLGGVDEADVSRVIEEIALSGMPRPVTHAITTAEGKRKVLSATLSPVKDTEGTFIGLLYIGSDITDRMAAEDGLAASLAFTRSILDTIDAGICVCDGTLTVLEANPAYLAWVGKLREDVIGHHVAEGASGLLGDGLYREALEHGRPLYRDITYVVEGRTRSARASLIPYDYEPRHILASRKGHGALPLEKRLITLLYDTTDLHTMETLLEHSERKFRGIFDNACDGMIVLLPAREADGTIRDLLIDDMNSRALDICGLSELPLPSSPVSEILPQMASSGIGGIVQEVADTHMPLTIEEFHCTSLGEGVYLQISVFPAGERVVLSLRDVSERIHARGRLEDQAHKLAEKNEELERFVYRISHDLRSPISVIRGMAEILREDFGDALGPDGAYYLERIDANVGRLGTFITDLLRLSRIDRTSYPVETVDTYALVQDIAGRYRAMHPTVAVEVGTLPVVPYERPLLHEVFEVLIKNAFMYLGDQREPHITIRCTEREKDLLFSIQDNGIGIEAQYTEKIFKVFERLGDVDVPGSGIGLALAERIIRNHGGSLWVQSEKGSGSTFMFTIVKREDDMHGI